MLFLGCVFVLLVLLVFLVRTKPFRKKNKEFKTTLIISFTLLLNFSEIDLHIFADACSLAFGKVAYYGIISNFNIKSLFIIGKSRS